ncbi:hypothetical protein CW304_07420 [Bacillus sp. UFRGS-B20]|nr:hypothetical protein CW304_07420 [Bacillus sp. UFRGS-B20]
MNDYIRKRDITQFFFGLYGCYFSLERPLRSYISHEDVTMQPVHQRLIYMITGDLNAQTTFISNSLFVGFG